MKCFKTWLAVWGLVGLLVVAPSARAHDDEGDADMDDVGYLLEVTDYEPMLETPNDMMTQKLGMWRTRHGFAMDRSMPFIKLTNTSAANAGAAGQITEMTMTIGDQNFFFDWVKVSEAAGLVVSTLGLQDGADNQVGVDQFKFGFTGFDPGESLILQVQLERDDLNMHSWADFRNIFFDRNGNAPGDNALVTIKFANGGTREFRLPDFNSVAPIQPLGLAIFHQRNDVPEVFADSHPPAPAVPEPATWLLSLCGGLGLVGLRSRRAKAA